MANKNNSNLINKIFEISKQNEKNSSSKLLEDNSEAFKLALETFNTQIAPVNLDETKIILNSIYSNIVLNPIGSSILFSSNTEPKISNLDSNNVMPLTKKSTFCPSLDFLNNSTMYKNLPTKRAFSNRELETTITSLVNNHTTNYDQNKERFINNTKQFLCNKRSEKNNNSNINNSSNLTNKKKIIFKVINSTNNISPIRFEEELLFTNDKLIDESFWTKNLLTTKSNLYQQKSNKSKEFYENQLKPINNHDLNYNFKGSTPESHHSNCSASISSQPSSRYIKKGNPRCSKEHENENHESEGNLENNLNTSKSPCFKSKKPFSVVVNSEPVPTSKIEYKRMLNRKAAKRCRQKKKFLVSKLIEENSNLRKKIKELEHKNN
jgi:hypothetical protein